MLDKLTVASSKTPVGIGYLLLGVLGFKLAVQLSPAEIRVSVTCTALQNRLNVLPTHFFTCDVTFNLLRRSG